MPRRLFHDKPGKNPDYSLINTWICICYAICMNIFIYECLSFIDNIFYIFIYISIYLKGEHNVYSLVPNIHVCIYIDQKWIYIKLFWMFNTKLFFKISTKWPTAPILDVRNSLFNHISGHFRSIWNFNFFEIFGQNGCRRLFWMSENHFRSHFWPFQINMKLFFFFKFTKWSLAPILDVQNSHLIEFLAISDRYATFFWGNFFDKMAAVGHFGCPKFTFDRISGIWNFYFFWIFFYKMATILDVRNSLLIAFLAISDRSAILDVWMHFLPFQIDRPFWMSKIHFRWHFWPFQIHMELNFWTKWPSAAILDGTTMSIIELIWDIWMSDACVKKSLSITILAISDRYRFFFSAAILDVRKSLSIAFLAISDPSAILDVQNSLSMAFLAISDPYGTSIFFGQNGRQWPFWISENNFWSHFWPFQIDTQLFLLKVFDKMAAGGHFGWDDNVNYRTRPRYLDE